MLLMLILNGIKTLLANGHDFPLFIKCLPVFSHDNESLTKNFPDRPVLHKLMNHLQNPYEASKIVYWLIPIYVEN